MKKSLCALFSLTVLFFSCHAQERETFAPIAVVELFTSEGCSSCPPADGLLTRLTDETEHDHRRIYTLSFHVDYWDRLGWKDPFSSSLYSGRQRQYAEVMGLSGVYTPQAIVNGSEQCVGSDESALNAAVSKALRRNATAAFTKLNISAKEDQKISIHYELKGDIKDCEIHFALVSNQECVAVKRGENSGRQLTHTHVVRQFITLPAATLGEVAFDLSSLSAQANVMVISFVQDKRSLYITAASEVHLK